MLAKISEVASLLALPASAVLGWLVWSLRKEFVRQDDHNNHKADVERRIAHLENELNGMPTSDETKELLLAIENMRGNMRALEARVGGQYDILRRVEVQLNRVDNYLLTREHK